MYILPWSAQDVKNKLLRVADYCSEYTINDDTLTVQVDHEIVNGSALVFKMPTGGTEISLLEVQSGNRQEATTSKKFILVDTLGNAVELGNIFTADSIIEIITELDTGVEGADGRAFILNYDPKAKTEDWEFVLSDGSSVIKKVHVE